VGKPAWDAYVVNPTQKRWDEMTKRLTPDACAKLLEIDKLQEKISNLEAEKVAVK